MRRRDFLKAAGAMGAAMAAGRLLGHVPASLAAASRPVGNAPKLPTRPYGRTAIKLSIIGFGGIVVDKAEQEHANRLVAESIERGVNYFDVAPTYGNAESKLGPALQPYRKNVFLACKTTRRDKAGAQAELAKSLEHLRTDHLDLYQLHALTDMEKDVEAVFAKGGAMEAFTEAKRAGVVRHIGFSAHSVEAALAAMDRYDFDSVLFPVNFACWFRGDFGPQVVEKARAKNAAILAIKAIAERRWGPGQDPLRKKFPQCWYRPVADRDKADLALRFCLSRPVTATVPPGDESLFRLCLDLAMNFEPLKADQTERVRQWAMDTPPLFQHEPAKVTA